MTGCHALRGKSVRRGSRSPPPGAVGRTAHQGEVKGASSTTTAPLKRNEETPRRRGRRGLGQLGALRAAPGRRDGQAGRANLSATQGRVDARLAMPGGHLDGHEVRRLRAGFDHRQDQRRAAHWGTSPTSGPAMASGGTTRAPRRNRRYGLTPWWLHQFAPLDRQTVATRTSTNANPRLGRSAKAACPLTELTVADQTRNVLPYGKTPQIDYTGRPAR